MTHSDNVDSAPDKPDRLPPTDDLRARIEATVAAIAEKLSPVPQLERSLRRWRIGFFLLGAVAAGIVGFGLHVALPELRGAEAVAALTPDGAAPAFLVATTADGHALLVRRLAAAPAPGRAHHLWLMRDDGGPVALGRLDEAATRLPRPSDLAATDLATARFAVTLEPAGAPPTAPGAIVVSGRLVPMTP